MSLGGIDRIAADFQELGERAARRSLRVGYEALAWGKHVDDHRDAWEIVRRADHPNIGLILDSFHTLARGIDPATIRSIPKDRIFAVQLADAPQVEMELMMWSRTLRCLPGEGDLPVSAFARSVMATGYDGTMSIEIFVDQFLEHVVMADEANQVPQFVEAPADIGRLLAELRRSFYKSSRLQIRMNLSMDKNSRGNFLLP